MNSKVMMMAALAVCGCASLEEENPSVMGDMVELSFSVPCQKSTKVTGAVAEDAVNDLQIFVFGNDGLLQAYGHSESDELTLTCSTGEKRVAALVNAPAAGSVVNEETLKNLVSSFSDNSLGDFVMSGLEGKTIEKGGKVTVPVSRLVSKVVLNSVRNDFQLQQHRDMDFKIKSVFLTNAAKDRKYLSASSPSEWYNKGVSDMSQIIAQAGTLMYDASGSSRIAYGTTYKSDCFLYCYPNPKSAGSAPTYLVVEATLGQTVYYYPVALPAMESNKCYSVTLTVCSPGSSSPDVPVEKMDALFDVQVLPWSENVSVNETI
jgi:hypothetical protein